MLKLPLYILLAALFSCCTPQKQAHDTTIYVSILPLRNLVSSIVGDDFDIKVLVPAGASPETFEPTPKQFAGLNDAQLIFNVGLIDFETTLLSKIENTKNIVDLSRGIEVIAGTCSHSCQSKAHAHGIDPHIWTSPKALQQMAANAYTAINQLFPDSTKYLANYNHLITELQALDTRTAKKIAASGSTYFIIYHPALTYYARDYALQQVAIEADGKEPSAKRLSQIIGQARKDGVRRILYQSQFPASTVEIIAHDIDAQATQIDPLREDIIANIDDITNSITTR